MRVYIYENILLSKIIFKKTIRDTLFKSVKIKLLDLLFNVI